MQIKLIAMALTGLIAIPLMAADLYRWVDKDGKVNYTDQPPPADAREVEEKAYGGNTIEVDTLPFATKDAVKKNPVTLYTSNCGVVCDNALALLSKRGIPYTTKSPQTSQPDADALKKLIGDLQVPVLVIGSQSPIKGFEAGTWESALDSAGYPKQTAIPRKGAGSSSTPVPAKAKAAEAAPKGY
jgi:glutaredoxin